MRDIWAFLLQTLTASGAAAMLLLVKRMLRDKLSPRWQFGIWGVLGLTLLVPAGLGGRYALINWPFLVEALRSGLTGEFGALARVAAPVPLPPLTAPHTAADWVFAIYAAGAVVLLLRYLVSYFRLRLALRRGRPVDDARIAETAARYGLPVCRAVEAPGLTSAFICGVFRPVLALPAGIETNEKVLLHELLHLRYHDAAWGLLICLLRCLHWCNPLLWRCADKAGNDLEALCDQRVLERLEGEARRDYGRILLSMANEKYARAPGTSSMANGGRNIRLRIESIARFKRYPKGMALASVCVALVLGAPCLIGTQAEAVYRGLGDSAALASARTAYCTTYAGAFDAYAKAVLDRNRLYRAMCAPLSEQNALAELDRWDCGLAEGTSVQGGYQIYNLRPSVDGWEGVLALELESPPEGEEWDGTVHSRWMAVQTLRAEKEGNRWVICPLDAMRPMQGDLRSFGNIGLPAVIYEAQTDDFIVRMRYQTTCCIDSWELHGSWFLSSQSFNTTPQPGGKFTRRAYSTALSAVYTGDPAKQNEIFSVGASSEPMPLGAERPFIRVPDAADSSGSSSTGATWGMNDTDGYWEEHGNEVFISGGGSSFPAETDPEVYSNPECYAADFYVNGEKTAELTLLPVKGGLTLD